MKTEDPDLCFLPEGHYDPNQFFENEILTVKGAAKFLKFSEKTVYKLAKERKIPFKKIGSEYRFLLSDLIGVIKKGT